MTPSELFIKVNGNSLPMSASELESYITTYTAL